jgi:hypothetical protein
VRASCAAPTALAPTALEKGGRHAAILALLSFSMLIVSLDQYIVVVALPDIGRELGYSTQTLQSVISAYAIASSGFLLFGGRASDLLGRRRILLIGLMLYCLASLAGGLATTAGQQLAARGSRRRRCPCLSQHAGSDQCALSRGCRAQSSPWHLGRRRCGWVGDRCPARRSAHERFRLAGSFSRKYSPGWLRFSRGVGFDRSRRRN